MDTAPALDPELTDFPYPYPVEHFSLRTQDQDLKMAFMDYGPRQRDTPVVVLLHGKNFSGGYWARTMADLARRGFRVLVPDQIGFGKSSKPARYQFTFQQLAQNTHQLLESRGIARYSVVGHSMGGMLATRMALMFPEEVTRLILVNPIGLEDWKTQVPYRTIQENFAGELKATPQSLKEYQRINYFGGKWKAEYDYLLTIPTGWLRHPRYPEVAWNSALTSDMIFTQPVLYEFPLLRVPTLLIIGQQDRTAIGKQWAPPEVAARLGNYPDLGKKAANAIPGAKLVEIPDAGHLPHVQTYEAYLRALGDFLPTAKAN